MSNEIFTTAFIVFSTVFVGLGAGYLLLKLQGGEE
ncbi:MAG: cytochrome b6-f complex subunit PetM [Oscillatoriaceae bacterium SKW80]|nr:cytochrome b6-f complex subunit PetM [Oscillatoriaceae bacterium SKYG93]MCX8120488.1 cytochrome b6-f complex subunit PetM [Oscillatoriaceae bacterium SKW80]MDW8452726.1 cytochrome b6-f complex subunit PetM [Oscillatoriaceae cyanobacterium SKYGB_i_bin93]HIK27204.1 PetM family cytochrome b6-f complex subunit 7 [Oscillatoriaceae cyanobacterium M7585_C2015_266]